MNPFVPCLKTIHTSFTHWLNLIEVSKMFTFVHRAIILLFMKFFKENLLQFALLTTIMASVGSLYFSEIAKFPPCILCWYQRICMYPLVVILSIGIWKKDKNTPYFVLPLSLTGVVIAIYHNLLYYGIISESTAPCIQGISCTTKYIEWFGFITIPLLSLIAFLVITTLSLLYLRNSAKK